MTKQRRKTQITNLVDGKDILDILKVVRGHHKQSFANKTENSEEISKFLEQYKLAKLTEDEKEKSE